ncbi:MAG TPA: hypothetical protein PLB91_06930 [Spirochaetales bacterium]|nr:hypothetical protein [Spirochaetales bacterium]HRY52996.1 hypothetical protein [Spirochaetia bacterium]
MSVRLVDYSFLHEAMHASGQADRALEAQKDSAEALGLGLAQSVISVSQGVMDLIEESKLSQAKLEAIDESEKSKDEARKDLDQGKVKQIEEEAPQAERIGNDPEAKETSGKKLAVPLFEVSDERQKAWDEEAEQIKKKYKLFPKVRDFALGELSRRKDLYKSYVIDTVRERESAALQEKNNLLLSKAIDGDVQTGDFSLANVTAALDGFNLLPQQRELALTRAGNAVKAGIWTRQVQEAAKNGGLAGAQETISALPVNEEQRKYFSEAATAAVKASLATAYETGDQDYSKAEESAQQKGTPFLPDVFIKQELAKYPEWMREDLDKQLRIRQAQQNLEKGLTQYNQDRDHPNLSYLQKQYDGVQASTAYDGDEATRSTILGLYERDISQLKASLTGKNKEANDRACSTIETAIALFEQGKTPISGFNILEMIQNSLNQSDGISAEQAKDYRRRVIEHKFPAAKAFFDSMHDSAMSVLGFGKQKDDALSTNDRTRVLAFESTLSAKLSAELMKEGGDVTPQRIREIFDNAKLAANTKDLEQLTVPFHLFKSKGVEEAEYYTQFQRFLDSPAGKDVVFWDVQGNPLYLVKEPEIFKQRVESNAQYQVQLLNQRGIEVLSSTLEPEGLHDIAGSKIHKGKDGKEYRFFVEGNRLVPYSRGSAKDNWARIPDPPKPTPSPSPRPASAPVSSRDKGKLDDEAQRKPKDRMAGSAK